jgi:hypothetical protein
MGLDFKEVELEIHFKLRSEGFLLGGIGGIEVLICKWLPVKLLVF